MMLEFDIHKGCSMGRKRKLKSSPSKQRAQQRYYERQYALGRKARKFWTTDEEGQFLRRVLANFRTEKLKEKMNEANETGKETKRSAYL